MSAATVLSDEKMIPLEVECQSHGDTGPSFHGTIGTLGTLGHRWAHYFEMEVESPRVLGGPLVMLLLTEPTDVHAIVGYNGNPTITTGVRDVRRKPFQALIGLHDAGSSVTTIFGCGSILVRMWPGGEGPLDLLIARATDASVWRDADHLQTAMSSAFSDADELFQLAPWSPTVGWRSGIEDGNVGPRVIVHIASGRYLVKMNDEDEVVEMRKKQLLKEPALLFALIEWEMEEHRKKL